MIFRFLEEHVWEIYGIMAVTVLLCFSIYNFVHKIRPVVTAATAIPVRQVASDRQKKCTDSRGERITRRCLESIFNVPFGKCRPIYNAVTGQKLELDCYNADLKIAAEYNGRQHYHYTPFFHKNREAFRNQQYRDELKRIACEQEGILLVEIPFWVKETDIDQYIRSRLSTDHHRI